MICFDYNTVNGTCMAFGGNIVFRQDTIYERADLVALVLKETQIKCQTREGIPCAITFKLTNPVNNTYLFFLDHTQVHASKIYIESPRTRLTIDETSELETNGRSTLETGTVPG